MRNLGIGLIGRVGALAIGIATIVGCGDNGIVPIDAPPDIDAPIDAPLPPPVLTLTPLTSDFGSVTLGQTSPTTSFTVTNTGGSDSGAISAVLMGSGSSNFSIESNTCTTLAANATCTVGISFSPGTQGMKNANLQISATPGGSVVAALDGTGVPIGNLSISPPSNAFGNVVVGATSATAATFTVTNTGGTTTGTLGVARVGSDPNDFTIANSTCTGTLAAAGTCMITVNFTPSTVGAKSAQISVTANNGPGGTVAAAVSGTGLAGAQLAINPTLLDFGSVVRNAQSGNQTFTVTNVGGVASGPVTPALSGADASQFTIVSGNCSAALNPNATCNITVQFRPTTDGAKAAQLDVTATPGGAASATLQGNGIPPGQIVINPTSNPFADTTVGATSASQTFTVTNTGGAPTGALSTALGGVDPAHFTIVNGSNGCQGVVLAANGVCTIVITFSPTTGGPKSANITVSGTPGGVASAGLTGLAIPDALLTITPASFDYGSVGTGTQTAFQTFTIRNAGGQNTGALNVALNGPQAGQFISVNGCTAALAPNATCTVQVRFAPNINGQAVASLDVTSAPGGSVSAGLFGQGVDPAAIEIQPGARVFNNGNGPAGEVLLGESAIQTFTVTNNGVEPTGNLAITISGANAADYAQTNNCTTLPSGMFCTITVTFTPSARGTRTASINVVATPGGNVTASLTGNSLPRLELLLPPANPHVFVDTVVNTSAPPGVLVRVRNNTRTAQALVRTTSVSFGASAPFQIPATGCGGTLNSDATCDTIVEFEPDATGTFNESATWSLGAGGAFNTATQAFRGTGVDSLVIAPQTTNDFGNVAQGTASPSLVFVVTNPANSPTSGPIAANVAAPFQIIGNTCAGTTLAPNTSCTITVKYLPTVGGGVVQNGTIAVSASPGGSTSQAIRGTAVNPAALTFTPNTTLAFGNVFSGLTGNQTIVVSNPAGAAISGPVQFSLAGADMALYTVQPGAVQTGDCTNNVTTLGPGQSCNIRVRFSPTGTAFGAKNGAQVTISANPGTAVAKVINVTATSVSTISVAPASHNYGNRLVGSTISQVFTVTNNSGSAVTVTSTTPPVGSDFTITANTCTGSVSTTCTVTVRFAPATSGDFTGSFTVNSANGLATANLTGHGDTAPDVSWTETFSAGSPFDFGTTLAGELGETRVFTLRNNGETTAPAIAAIIVADPLQYNATTTCNGVALAGGATCTVTVRFTPGPSNAPSADVLATLQPMGTTGTNDTINVRGRRMASGAMTFNPTVASFPNTVQGLNSATQVVTILNTSGAAKTFAIGIIETLAGGSFSPDFTITAQTCGGTPSGPIFVGATLAAGTQCTVTVRFNPSVVGTVTAYLSVDEGALAFLNAAYAPLTGRGLAPANITVTGNPPVFPNTAVGGAPSSRTITLTNTGEVASGAVAISAVGGADAAMFTTSGCAGPIPAGNSCNLVVTFTPANVGPKSASFTVGATPGLATTTVTLNAMGVTNATIGITPTVQQVAGDRPNGAIDPAGTIYNITNGGDVPTGNLSVTLTDNLNYVIENTGVANACTLGAPMAANSNCNVRVKFNPKAVGTNLVTTVTASANPGASAAGSITGNGLPSLVGSPATNNYGNVPRGSASGPVTFTFTNRSAGTTGLLYTSLTGANATEFSLAGAMADDCAGKFLAPLGTCTITVVFTPATAPTGGTRNATLTVTGTPGDTANVALSGNAQ